MKSIFTKLLGLGVFVVLRRLITSVISGSMVESDLISMRQAVVELDIGAVDTWVAVESWGNMVTPTRGQVPTSEEKSLDGVNHTGFGTAGNATVQATIFATKDITDPLDNLYSLLGSVCDIRWSKAGATGDHRFYTSDGVITQCDPPAFDGNTNESAKFSFTITAADILKEIVV